MKRQISFLIVDILSITRRKNGFLTYLLLILAHTITLSQSKVWIDPAVDSNSSSSQSVVVWFDIQFLRDANSFNKKILAVGPVKRSVLRNQTIKELKRLSNLSYTKISNGLDELRSEGHLSNLVQHWVINGFSCEIDEVGLNEISNMTGVSKIFIKRPSRDSRSSSLGPVFVQPIEVDFDYVEATSLWNLEKIKAVDVWEKYEISGEGVLNVIHDSGFRIDLAPLSSSIYINKNELPGNGIDDDENGYIDDYHGFNFDANNNEINRPNIRRNTIIHGNICAAIISGGYEADSTTIVGIAPKSKWAPVIGAKNIEQAVEWAIEQGADTYSMSFSLPNMGEQRTHWRKIFEQATFCGIVFISGAGNFAAGANYAPVPVQMRVPEDIPNAVLGVAGVGQDDIRSKFSSQGPVAWDTHYYKEGLVNKPDFTTLNRNISVIDLEGKVTQVANGNSLAGPHMAGIVSLMFSANPELLPWEVKQLLQSVAIDIGDKGFDYQTGHGFVNALDAVEAAISFKK